MYIVKEKKRDPLCRCHDNGYAAGRVLIKTKMFRFYLKQRSSTLNSLMGRVKTIWEPCVFRARPSVPFQRVVNGHIWFFTERDWNQECCHGNKMVGVILFLLRCIFLVPSLKNTAPIFLEILMIQCFTFQVKRFMTSSLPSFA